ncbi:MAG TPA: 2-C-methyl-D-erythritol 4-phosphate cytidylyltransferase [Ktedonobacterales bacterium]|nr:2-C-methyl-D-erythritol 4-phosphate cytidylyltransferase [Ktedonobacterales bacterium]
MNRFAGTVSQASAPRAVAVILCAGSGSRMRADRNKVFLSLAGRPLLAHTLAAFTRATAVDELLLVAQADEVAQVRALAAEQVAARLLDVIAGGATRHQSEQRALAALRPRIMSGEIGVVLIHDGARPLVTAAEIDALAAAARAHGGALLGTPLAPNERLVRLAPDGTLAALVPAAGLWRAQTPQAFEARALLDAYDQAQREAFEGTDTAASFERSGHRVVIVAGSPDNVKVTTPDDLLRAEALLRERR